ncbi:hypothetical protein E1263_30755 [Kribbella antibiotica]|uniref:Uncharacterized protein n=1 Tax=Kribbella antibiotica TaxID=190195 RepID=A0A4R4Z072_9ACTN|nr:hypothetical protein [Kribbella antibiotica]TDD50710.1 hypothetical protein E1263_30755 [Kribbella antibiotica]
MSTPHQGPQGHWQQGDMDAAVRWLSSLDQADQVALRRSMQTQRALAPIYNAVNRSIEFTRQAGRSLSEGAQSLVSQTQQYGRDAAAWATRTGADLADRAGVTAAVAATRVSDGLDSAGRAISTGATTTRDAVVSSATATRDAVTSGAAATREAISTGAATTRDATVSAAQATGRAGVRAGQGIAAAAGRVSRWFQEKVSNTTGRAAAGYHAMKEFSAPDLNAQSAPAPGGAQLSPTAITGMASQVHAYATAASAVDRQAALNSLVGSMDKDNQAMLMAALINSGQAPAAGAVQAKGQAPQSRGTGNQPEKGPELGK